ncbi:MAG: putative oligopeptide/dipeptide transporter, oligopeptide/dipeptide-binding protein [Proteobacteria bacterium]|nr:putative oligopeptide/dipeptide transporter, oligopeptide/dipeptide-binding protein [Pseudomonadota bacterium]
MTVGKFKRYLRLAISVSALCCAVGNGVVQAQELKVGLSSSPVAIDPHFFNNDAISALCSHLYEPLIAIDAEGKLLPTLAVSWRAINDTTWEFKLRKGVRFHDGNEFTAEDVVFSLDRPASIANSPSSFTTYTKAIVAKKIVDPYTIQFVTATPAPLLPNDLTRIFIVSRKAADKASTDDFNQGRIEAGSGPFKLVKFSKGENLQLARFDAYWGVKPAWATVTLKFLPNDPARMAALLSGDVQLIENVQANLVAQFKANKDLSVFEKMSNRFMFLYTDHRDRSPFVTDKAGKPLDTNPLKDVRVRQAISKLIDRQTLTDKVLDKLGVPNANPAPPGMFGHNPRLKPEPLDIAGARKLLVEAGYPDGFGITLFGPSDRFINDEQVVQAIGQMLSKGGIATKVQTQPMASYIPKASKKELGFGLLGWGVGGGEPSSPLRGVLATTDKDRGLGASNWSSYSSAKYDAVLIEALRTVDDQKREKLFQDAAEIAINQDYAIIPLYNQVATWAARKGIRYTPRPDEATLAQYARPE